MAKSLRKLIPSLNIEALPAISVEMLRQAGLLKQGPVRRVRFMASFPSVLSSAVEEEYIEVETTQHPGVFHIFCSDDPDEAHEIEVVFSKIGVALQPFLICPIQVRRVRSLTYIEGHFMCRHQHGLHYQSQVLSGSARRFIRGIKIAAKLRGDFDRGPARGANRQRLLAQLQSLHERAYVMENDVPLLAEVPPPGQKMRAELREFERAERKGRRQGRASNTRSGLQGGQLPDSEISIPARRLFTPEEIGIDENSPIAKQPWPNSKLPRFPLEEAAAIDVRELIREHAILPGWHSQFRMAWYGEDGLLIRVDAHADLRHGPAWPGLLRLYTYVRSDDDVWFRVHQPIELRLDKGLHRRRWLFVDPASRPWDVKLCEMLFLREGLWGAAQSQRLAHRSQLGPNRKRPPKKPAAAGR